MYRSMSEHQSPFFHNSYDFAKVTNNYFSFKNTNENASLKVKADLHFTFCAEEGQHSKCRVQIFS